MKRLLLIIVIISTFQVSFSQDKKGKPFITSSLNIGFGKNEYFTGFGNEDEEYLLKPVSILLRTGFGYQFNRKWAAILYLGLDHHWKFGVTAIPAFGSLRYNIRDSNDAGEGDTFFIEVSSGKLWRPSSKFKDGNYFSLGFGQQIAGGERWNLIVRIDYHRKTIANFDYNGHLDSLSLGIGFSFY